MRRLKRKIVTVQLDEAFYKKLDKQREEFSKKCNMKKLSLAKYSSIAKLSPPKIKRLKDVTKKRKKYF